MNWEAIGAIGEVVGAVAVVISLLYLATQIRAQVNDGRLSAMRDISVGFINILADFSEPELSELSIQAASSGMDAFTDKQLLRVITNSQRVFRLWEEAFCLHQDGRLDERIWDGMPRQFLTHLSIPTVSCSWKVRGEFYGSDFRNFVYTCPVSDFKFR